MPDLYITRSPKPIGKGKKGKFPNRSFRPKKQSQAFVAAKNKKFPQKIADPSSIDYRDVTKKFSMVHTVESFITQMYNLLCKEGNSIIGILVDSNYQLPTIPAGSTQEVIRDHAKYYGTFVVANNVKSLISSMYDQMSQDYQQKIESHYPEGKWRVINSLDKAKEFINFVKKIKIDEKGAKRTTILEVKKSIANAKQYDQRTRILGGGGTGDIQVYSRSHEGPKGVMKI